MMPSCLRRNTKGDQYPRNKAEGKLYLTLQIDFALKQTDLRIFLIYFILFLSSFFFLFFSFYL